MADELGNEIRMLLGDMNGMSKPPSELGSWNAFAKIYDIRGGILSCALLDTALVPYENLFDFKLKFEDPSSSAFTSQIGVIFGGYDLQVRQLQPLLAEATEDTILWNIPKLDSLDGWKVAHLFAGGFSGWSQVSNAIHHNVDCIVIDSQVTIELDTRIAYAWSASFGHELFAAPLGPEFIPPPGICGSMRRPFFVRFLGLQM